MALRTVRYRERSGVHISLTACGQAVPVGSPGPFARSSAGPLGRREGWAMIRFLCRFVGLVSLTAAVTSLIYDGVRSFVNQTLHFSSVGSAWADIPKGWFAPLVHPAVERLAEVWDGEIQPYIFKQPVWLVLGILGAVLLWAKEEARARAHARGALSTEAPPEAIASAELPGSSHY